MAAGKTTVTLCEEVLDHPSCGREPYTKDFVVTPFGGAPVLIRGCCDAQEAKRFWYERNGEGMKPTTTLAVARYTEDAASDRKGRPDNPPDKRGGRTGE